MYIYIFSINNTFIIKNSPPFSFHYKSFFFQVKSDSELCAYLSIPTIMQSKEKLEMLFSQVDSLEKFVNHVKSDANTVESQLNIAEEEIGQNSGSLKNMFRPLFFVSYQYLFCLFLVSHQNL